MSGLGEFNLAARTREAINKLALDAIESTYPRPRYATVQEIFRTERRLVVQYPDEAIPFSVQCGAIMPLEVGQVVRIAGPNGARFVDDVIGAASFDGLLGTTETWPVASEAEMLALTAKRGDVAVRTDIDKSFILRQTPASTLANWQELLTADATAAAENVVANHEAALDPHAAAGYITSAEADALFTTPTEVTAQINAHATAADPHTQYVKVAGGSTIQPTGATIVPLVIRGHATQSADLLQVLDGGGVARVWVTSGGVLSGSGAGLTSLNATNIASGTLASARLPATIAATTTGTAAAWTTARTLTLTGDATGTVSVRGDAAMSLAVTVVDDSHIHDTRYYTEAESDSRFVNVAGDTMTAPLALSGAPTLDLHAATKKYVDDELTELANLADPFPQYLTAAEGDAAYVNVAGDTITGALGFGSVLRQMLNLYGTTYGLGIQSSTFYQRAGANFAWYAGGSHNDAAYNAGGGTELMRLSASQFAYLGQTVWHAGNDGPGSALDADTLDGAHRNDLTEREELEALLGDKLDVGTYDASTGAKPAPNWTPPGASNMIPDSSFELDSNGDGTANDWTTSKVRGAASTFTPTLETDDPPSGLSYQRITYSMPDTDAPYLLLYPTAMLPATAGLEYAARAKLRWSAQTVDTEIRFVFYFYAGTTFLGTSATNNVKPYNSTSAATDWATFTTTGTAPATTTQIRVFFFLFKRGGIATVEAGNFDVDDVEFIQGTVADMADTYTPKPSEAYRHGMMWTVATPGEVDFIDADYSGRYDVGVDDPVYLNSGDIVLAFDPLIGTRAPGTILTQPDMVFQYIPYSAETYVKSQIAAHASSDADPHAAAGYLTRAKADPIYAPLSHEHTDEIVSAISEHELRGDDPHAAAGYLTKLVADGYYITIGTSLPYEPIGAVQAHEEAEDPHGQYVTPGLGNELWADINHDHDDEYLPVGWLPPAVEEVRATDGAQSAGLFFGSVEPVDWESGDVWFETFDISLQPPAAPSGLTAAAPTGTSVTVSWAAWAASADITAVTVERSLNGSTGWTNILNDTVAPFATSVVDAGRAENTIYYYRVRATNATGSGSYGTVAVTTANDPPASPGGLSTSGITASVIRLNWSSIGGLHATQPYEVFLNGVSYGFVDPSPEVGTGFKDFTGLSERTQYTLGVRAKDPQGAVSATVNVQATTLNGAPPAPAGLQSSGITHNQATLSWAAVTGITDFKHYEVFKNGVSQGTTTGTSWTFTGLSGSTAHTFGVRAVDQSNATSSTTTLGVTTLVNPDSTPPVDIVVDVRPDVSYGQMWTTFTVAADCVEYQLFRSINGSAWVQFSSITPTGGSQAKSHLVGTYDAGTSIRVLVRQWDAAGNLGLSYSNTYTLMASPHRISPNAANAWRNEGGGLYLGGGNAYQDYYSNSAYNARGMFYYGTRPQTELSNARRTITNVRAYMVRDAAGSATAIGPTPLFYLHGETTDPGGVAAAAPTLNEGPIAGPELRHPDFNDGTHQGWSGWLGSTWANYLVNGTRRGIATYDSTPSGVSWYQKYANPALNGNSGMLEFTHLG